MSILKIDKFYFTGDDLNIPNISSSGVGQSGAVAQGNLDKLNKFIDKKEPEFLKKVLGKELYLLYKAGMEVVADNPIEKWVKITNYLINTELKTSAFANFIWWNWSRSTVSSSMATGETIAGKENGKSVSPIDHQVGVWNEMVDMLFELREFIESSNDYKEFLPDEDIYSKQNSFNF